MFYRYDNEGKFTGKTTGQKNPKESGFLQPANSTLVPVPLDYSINEWPVFNTSTQKWHLVESDYKKAMDTQNLEEIINGVHTYKLVGGVVVEKTQTEFDAELVIFQEAEATKLAEEQATQYQRDREEEYEAQGLTFDSFIEMLIENDAAAMAQYRSKRDAIKVLHPKPIQGE